ncbi:hypothetical protein AUJ14_00735 [Candidatus Micrarchaeota archaeon CG1_02_55_22]|nr:MAG: hypothetical protein AUJ14_00735 [Candidatus Micrarchaeota archaeon CG1_02_55_22]
MVTEILVQLAVFAVSLVVLMKAADGVIRQAIAAAELLGLSELVAGFVLVSVATALPELTISTEAALKGAPGVAVGTVFGSIMANLLFILGIVAIVGGIRVGRKSIPALVRLLFAISVVSLLLLFLGAGSYTGFALLLVFVAYVYTLVREKFVLSEILFSFNFGAGVSGLLSKYQSIAKTLVLLLVGIFIVVLSSNFLVDSSVKLAVFAGVPTFVIAATIVAVGTSLPELSVALAAVRRGHGHLALGNLVGSSITDLTLVLGTAALFTPIAPSLAVNSFLVMAAVIASLLLWYLIEVNHKLARREGIILLAAYFGFIVLMLSKAV